MSVLLKQAFISRGQKNIYKILQNTRDQLYKEIKLNKTKTNLNRLESFLNEYYYPKDKSLINPQSKVAEYQDILIQEAQKNIESALDQIDLSPEGLKKSSYKHDQTAAKSTVEAYLTKLQFSLSVVQKEIESIGKQGGSLSKLKTVEQNIINLANQVHYFLNHEKSNQALTRKIVNSITYQGGYGKAAVALIKKMSIYISAINSGKNMNAERVGSAFERSLGEAIEHFAEKETNELIKSTITGKNTVDRGIWKRQIMGDISYTIKTDGLEKLLSDNFNPNNGFTYKEGNLTFKYSPGSGKQAKMDVYGNYAVGPLRISAKSWTNDSRSVGTTSVAAGLTRAVGPNIMEYYSLSMIDSTKDYFGNERPKWESAEAGHDLAQLAIASDIVMGLNQRSKGRAEILIVDTGSSIVVKDISTLVSHTNNIKNYRKDKIEQGALDIYRAIRKVKSPGRTDTFLGLYISSLDKMKVSYDLQKDLNKI